MTIIQGKSKFNKSNNPLKGMRKHEREEYLAWAKKVGIDQKPNKSVSTVVLKSNLPPRGKDKEYNSLNNGVDSTFAVKQKVNYYTGVNILGIGTLHKSNAIPIFSTKEAEELSKMRR